MARRAKLLRIRAIAGIKDVEIELGAITEIRGRNATGKSSTLNALRALLGGGHDATLLRKGEKKGEAVLVLDDGIEAEFNVTESGTTRKVSHPDLGPIKSPAAFLEGLRGRFNTDPLAFLTVKGDTPKARNKERARLLLEAVPMTVTAEQIGEALGVQAKTVEAAGSTKGHALTVIDRYRKSTFDARTDVNRSAKDKRATAEQLRRSLPEDEQDPAALREAIAQHEGDANDLEESRTEEMAAIEEKRQRARDDVKRKLDIRIEEYRKEFEEKVAEQRAFTDALIDQIDAAAKEKEEEVDVSFRPSINRHQQETIRLRALLEEAVRQDNTRQLLASVEHDAGQYETEAERLTGSLERLDALKAELLEKLPIPGVEVTEDDILINGIPFERVNHGEQIKGVAVPIAKLHAGDLGLITIDGLEALDEPAYNTLLDELEAAGIQAVVTRVTDEPFTITSGSRKALPAGGGNGEG